MEMALYGVGIVGRSIAMEFWLREETGTILMGSILTIRAATDDILEQLTSNQGALCWKVCYLFSGLLIRCQNSYMAHARRTPACRFFPVVAFIALFKPVA